MYKIFTKDYPYNQGGFPGGSDSKKICLECGRLGFDCLEKEMATHYSILAHRIPWTEEPGQLLSMGLQRFRHDWATNALTIKAVYGEGRSRNGYSMKSNCDKHVQLNVKFWRQNDSVRWSYFEQK